MSTQSILAGNNNSQTNRHLAGILQTIQDSFGGTNIGGSNVNSNGTGLLNVLNAGRSNIAAGQTLSAARSQGLADSQGLVAAALKQFNDSILPQLTGAAEGAGASASALNALLAQNAGANSAGEVAKMQGNQILGQEQIATNQRGQDVAAQSAQQASIMQLISGLINQSLQTQARIPAPKSSPTQMPSRLPRGRTKSQNTGPIYGPQTRTNTASKINIPGLGGSGGNMFNALTDNVSNPSSYSQGAF